MVNLLGFLLTLVLLYLFATHTELFISFVQAVASGMLVLIQKLTLALNTIS